MSNRAVISFVVALCFIAALILAILSTSLSGAQEQAKELDRAKLILASANLMPEGKVTAKEIYALFDEKISPFLTNAQGEVKTFEELNIDPDDYLADHAKTGYANLEWKLFYKINPEAGYIIPISGFGLWGPIYGYLALEPDGDTVIGTTWEAPAETPGLGAVITEPWWQAQFAGKKVFREGATDLQTAPLGISVVKGKVSDVFGDSPKAESAVDGISGATLTGDGVSAAIKADLSQYRELLIKAGTNENP